MEGSDVVVGNGTQRGADKRFPKLHDRVVLQVGREYREGVVMQVATDRDGEIGRVRVRYQRFGLAFDKWVSATSWDVYFLQSRMEQRGGAEHHRDADHRQLLVNEIKDFLEVGGSVDEAQELLRRTIRREDVSRPATSKSDGG